MVNEMKQGYSFFLFCQLVNDDLINVNNLHIQYDNLFPVLEKHFEVFKNFDNDMNISEHEAIEKYLNYSGSLLAELMSLTDVQTWERPKPKGYTFLFDIETPKTIEIKTPTEEILKQAISEGHAVHWKNDGYIVLNDNGVLHIKFVYNGYYTKLQDSEVKDCYIKVLKS